MIIPFAALPGKKRAGRNTNVPPRITETTFAIVLSVAFIVLLLPVQASGHGFGFDIIRLVDKNQDDGMINVHGQVGLTGDTALTLGYASGDDLTILDAGFKYYFGRYVDSVFIQLGIGYYDHDHDDDFGFVCSFGYERRLARYLAVSGSVRMVAGVDEQVIGYPETPVFQPTLSIMIVF